MEANYNIEELPDALNENTFIMAFAGSIVEDQTLATARGLLLVTWLNAFSLFPFLSTAMALSNGPHSKSFTVLTNFDA